MLFSNNWHKTKRSLLPGLTPWFESKFELLLGRDMVTEIILGCI